MNARTPLRFFSILLILFISNFGGNAQIVINEFSSSNAQLKQDDDGDYPDWIELYNTGATPVNIFKYSITDKLADTSKWTFPNYVIPPNNFLLLYASGKDRKSTVHHWETAIKDNDTWKYIVPASEPVGDWHIASFNDGAWNSGKGGFGFGDGDDSTIVGAPAQSIYIRKTFTVLDKTKIAEAVLHIDYDDGYCAYLNGVPIGRANMPSYFAPYNTGASGGREATMYGGGLPETRLINHDTLIATLVNGTNVLSIQVHNTNLSSSDLTARAFLSFGISDPSVLYSPTPAWFNISNNLPMHTNFKLAIGETLYLYDSLGTLQDSRLMGNSKADHSLGRKPDGATTWTIFTAPTPGTSNSSAASIPSYCNDVINFSVPAGFYPSARTVAITGSSVIRYTLDGSEPKPTSTLYTSPVVVGSTKVLRAGCFTGGTLPFLTSANTYFINESTTLPVFSISTDPSNFFDPITGIYMLGPDADSTTSPYFGANFWEDWERPVHVEFFEKDRTQKIDQGADIRIYGNYSRANPQKSLNIMASGKYGADNFAYQFFPDKPAKRYSQIVLRNSGGDFNVLHYRDGFVQKLMQDNTDIDIQDYRPAVTFINGQYWGILNIREKINSEYVENNHGINKKNVDLTETWGNALEGSNNIYFMQWVAKNFDLALDPYYQFVADSFDIDNMVDYFSAEIFISNWDWPQNNMKYWRDSNGKRKWRFILWDTDLSLGLYNLQDYNFNQLGKVKNAGTMTIGPVTDIFSEMLKNTTFRNKFVNRYADLMNTTFQTANMTRVFDAMADTIDAEIPRQYARWNAWANWDDERQKTKTFYTNRLNVARNEVKNEFNLAKRVNITLAVAPAGAGYIKINSISPNTYPWTGVYYDGVPVMITVIPNPGYTFSYWQSSTLLTSPVFNDSITINVTSANETFTAHFTGSSKPIKLTVSEFNYHSLTGADAGDWIELHNYSVNPADLSGWTVGDNFHTFTIPNGTTLAPNGYLVICEDTTKFKSQHPTITNFIGQTGFSLSNDGDHIEIRNLRKTVILSFDFNDSPPWPFSADGLGYTCESYGPTYSPGQASSWFSGCLGGSPGHGYNTSCTTPIIDHTTFGYAIDVYPNPAKNNLTVDLNNTSLVEWKIINYQGQEILTKKTNSNSQTETIDISGFAPGMYSLIFIGENSRCTKKIIIQ